MVGFLTSGASDFISNRAHFSFETSTCHITLDISVIYDIHFQDRYKGPSCNIHINPRSVNPNCEMKDFKKKIEFCRFAFITCVKKLIK